MTEIKVDISELKSEGEDLIKELAEFLKEKTNAEVDKTTETITVKGEAVSRKYLRVLLKKFLHKSDLKDYFRVISGKENALVVKEKKITEEE
ncbi:MAG: 60S ribosomal protein L22 [Candidatus Bathyarchaeia archaeon]